MNDEAVMQINGFLFGERLRGTYQICCHSGEERTLRISLMGTTVLS